MTKNRQIMIRALPTGALALEHFEMVESDLPTPGEGQVLIKTLILSQDAANRAWMQGATYRDAIGAGDVMSSGGIGEVV